MKPDSHLYEGFRFAGALSSIATQRKMQREILISSGARHLLSIGCGFGEELECLLSNRDEANSAFRVVGTDIAPVEGAVSAQPSVAMLGKRFEFSAINLLDIDSLSGFMAFDLVQCGFVLHDIEPGKKDYALDLMARAILPAGLVMVSDIFLTRGDIRAESQEIYDCFITEASEALDEGRLDHSQHRALTGDGTSSGLIRARLDAVSGKRDHFEKPSSLIDRARKAGLVLQQIWKNPRNERLQVLTFSRAFEELCEIGVTDKARLE